MSKKYPKIIYVQYQGEDENEYLQIEKSLNDILDDGAVAIYELKEIKIRKTEISLN